MQPKNKHLESLLDTSPQIFHWKQFARLYFLSLWTNKTQSQTSKTGGSMTGWSLAEQWTITEIRRQSNFCADLFPAHRCSSIKFKKGLERASVNWSNLLISKAYFRHIKWTVCKKWKRNSGKPQLLIKSFLMVANRIILETENVFRSKLCKVRFKRRATAVPNSIDRIKFDFSTAVAWRLKPSRATRQ